MSDMFSKTRKYISIYLLFAKNSLIAQMEYRTNFFISVLIEIAFLLSKILYVIVVFNAGVDIYGLSPYEILMFIGSYTIITGVMDALYFPNFSKISEYVRNGDLDTLITKPISLQFLVTLRYVDYGLAIPNVIAGSIMVFVSWTNLNVDLSILNLAGYIFFLLIGVIVTYPVLLFPSLLAFWIVKTQAINDITFALWDFNNMPMGIYGKWLQRIGVFIIPIFLITNFAPMFVLKRLSALDIIWAVIAPILFAILVRFFWKFAMKNYTSASS